MTREFLINMAILVGINLLIKPVYIFGIDRGIQNTLPPEHYGYYFVLFNFVWLFQIINDFGIAYYNSRNISQYPHLLGKYFPHLLTLKVLLALVFAIVTGLAAALWGFEPGSNALLWYIALNQVLSAMVLFLRSNVAGLGMYRLDSVLSALDRLIVIVICGALLWTPIFQHPFRIEYFIWAQTAAFLATGAVAFAVINRKVDFHRWKPRPQFVSLLMRRSFPYALAVFLMTIYTRIDAVMIDRLLPTGKAEASIYAAAYRLLDAANILGFLFAGLLLPMFSRMLKSGESVDSLAHLGFRLLCLIALPLAAFCTFFGREIMDVLYIRADNYYGEVLSWLMWSFVPMCGMYIYGTLLTANGSLQRMNIIFFGGLLANILLNTILIPRLGAVGASMATCVTQFAVWMAEMVLLNKELSIAPDKSWYFRTLGLAGTTISLAWWMSNVSMVWGFGSLAVAAILWGLLDLREIKRLWAAKATHKR
jgi:O-antigen/teichoic acid export membrane protein